MFDTLAATAESLPDAPTRLRQLPKGREIIPPHFPIKNFVD
jgi:hypothetical protein